MRACLCWGQVASLKVNFSAPKNTGHIDLRIIVQALFFFLSVVKDKVRLWESVMSKSVIVKRRRSDTARCITKDLRLTGTRLTDLDGCENLVPFRGVS